MGRIVLASGSPRRKEILSKFNINFDIEISDIEEKVGKFEEPAVVSMALAFEKAKDVMERTDEDAIIISADTIVVVDNEILGKPKSREDGKNMMMKLSGSSHEVITGFSIVSRRNNKKIVDYEVTKVKFRDMDEDLINRYLDTLEYKDKAGGYGIQGIGSILIEKIDGCYFNVMGLPIHRLGILLEENFDTRLL